MIVYFAGVNQIFFCEAFIGRHVLESFTDSRKLYGRYRAAFASMILDCGAGSKAAREGRQQIDISRFADFCLQHGAFYRWIASLDSVRGGVELNMRNWQYMLDRGIDAVPTFHQGEPVSVLREYCSRAKRIGLGFRDRPIAHGEAFLDEAFSVIPACVAVHGWAMTNYTDRWPFESVDSTSWLHELKALRKAQTTQHSSAFGHLTDGELIEIVQKRYDRLPKTMRWSGKQNQEFRLTSPEAA